MEKEQKAGTGNEKLKLYAIKRVICYHEAYETWMSPREGYSDKAMQLISDVLELAEFYKVKNLRKVV